MYTFQTPIEPKESAMTTTHAKLATLRRKHQKKEQTEDEKRAAKKEILNARFSTAASTKAEKVVAAVLAAIKDCAKKGKSEYDFGTSEYSMADYRKDKDRFNVAVLHIVAEILRDNPHNLRVNYSDREGYNGEGNNMSDFYTTHSWTVSW